MTITASTLTLPGVTLNENPLPRFSDAAQNRTLAHDGTFNIREEKLFGFQTGAKVLPYTMQDRYTRNRKPLTVKTIVLENENLRATFLPDYGARLYSLFSKKENRELLYKNDMLQFGNLAQRDAWFSGGVEFNFGHYGHAHLTNAPMFAVKVNGPGAPFLRFYEYERVTSALCQMDFHLPCGADTLDMYVRLQGLENADIPAYWWTNAAVRQEPGCRVFSGESRVLFNLPRFEHTTDKDPCFAGGEMPRLKCFDGDASYPAEIPMSLEYFFQNDAHTPWEAIGYKDGSLFFELSTKPLNYRKMFCWGTHRGGERWQKHLNAPDQSRYLEIQAGLARTQLHGEILPAGGVITFTQSFGSAPLPQGCLEAPWQAACRQVAVELDMNKKHHELTTKHIRYNSWATIEPVDFLHFGSGYGALESARLTADNRQTPAALPFPAASLGKEQAPWLALLQTGILPENTESFMTSEPWLRLLWHSIEKTGGNWAAYLHLGIMLMEQNRVEDALRAWEQSTALKPSKMAWRNKGQAWRRLNDAEQAVRCYETAFCLEGDTDAAYHEEYLNILVQDGQLQKAWAHYAALPGDKCTDITRLTIAPAAVALQESSFLKQFFEEEHPSIREGVNALEKIWAGWKGPGAPIPEHIDFRMTVSNDHSSAKESN